VTADDTPTPADPPEPREPSAPPTGLRALLPDLAPWRASADFRKLWVAGLISNFGSFLTFVALPVQIKDLTGSAAAVGAVGAVELVPLIVFGLYGDGGPPMPFRLWGSLPTPGTSGS
jgi:hypothetical protein